jgi:hypothetical protein
MLEVARQANGAVLVEPRVQVAGNLDILAGRLDHHFCQLDHPVMLPLVGSHVELVLLVPACLAAGMAIGADVEIDLERAEAGFQHLVHFALDLIHVHAGRHFAVAINADVVAELAAHQLIDRHLERLALEIPQRDLDAGQRGDQRPGKAALEHQAAADVLENGVDGKGVATDQFMRQLMLDDGDGLMPAMHAFAQARNAGIGFDAYPQMHAMAARRRRLDRCDLHLASPNRRDPPSRRLFD